MLPDFLAGEKVLLVASGEVEAGVNLDELSKDDVRVEGERVIVELPEARILDSSLDEEETRLYDRERGLLNAQGDDDLVEEARLEAERRIVEAAKNQGILQQAESNAEDSIRVFVNSMGYEEVAFA